LGQYMTVPKYLQDWLPSCTSSPRAKVFVVIGRVCGGVMASTTAVIEPNDQIQNQISEREEGPDPERRLWAAVLLLAVDEWRSNNMRAHRDAEVFLFEGGKDFETVCQGAGLEPSILRSKLMRLRNGPLPETRQRLHIIG